MPAVGRANKPKSLVEHLSEQAPKRPVNDIVSINRYLMSARLLLNQASEYRSIGDEEQLYVILLRYASLVVETIPKHRDFRDNVSAYASLKRELLERYLPELERLKASLRLKERAEPPAAHSRNRPADAVRLSVSALPELDWAASGAATAPPPPDSAGAMAAAAAPPPPPMFMVDDLLEVIRDGPTGGRTSASGQAVQPPPPYGGYGSGGGGGSASSLALAGPADPYALAAAAAASLAAGSPDVPPPKYAHVYASSSGRHTLFGAPPGGRGDVARSAPTSSAPARPRYPALDGPAAAAAVELMQLSIEPQMTQQLALALPQPSAGPSLGPQEIAVRTVPSSAHGLPDTCSVPHGSPPPSSTALAAPGGPKELVKRAQMRDVHVSVALMEEFLQYARSNTARGIESCGILAGRLLAGDSTFAITTLIIPKQQGTTDTVQALNEEEIFEAQFERELYPMGWIHTHPTQTCFLSSVDVHTHCGYQTMLDEAVAIVMAPTDQSKRCGIFRLSTPGGLSLVQKCPNRGFHTHPPTETGQELYELCGHVFLNPRTRHEVLDLR